METNKYPAGNVKEHGTTRIDHRDKVCKLEFDFREIGLSPQQRERFIFLLGPRYKEKNCHRFKIVAKQYLTFGENYYQALD